MRSILIGSQGMLGKELSAILDKKGYETVKSDINPGEGETKLDITDRDSLLDMVNQVKPQVIYNCSAYTNVDLAEEQEELAAKINGYGVENIAMAAKSVDALLVHISTDYVFAGDNDKPYLPDDPTGPQGAYGRTKLIGEQLIQQTFDNYQIIRTAWLFGPQGKNFVETIVNIARGRDEINVVNDQHGCPTWAPDLARCMADMSLTDSRGLFHFCNGPACTWFDLAKEAISVAGVNCNVIPCTSEQFPRPAKRPAWSVMDSSKTYDAINWTPDSWQQVVAKYAKTL